MRLFRTIVPAVLLALAPLAAMGEEGGVRPDFLNSFPGIADIDDIMRSVEDFDKSSTQPETPSIDVYQTVLANLQGSGIPENFIKNSFSDPNVRIHPEITDLMTPKPDQPPPTPISYEEYKKLIVTPKRIADGVKFYGKNKELLEKISAESGVDPLILTSLIGVETTYGTNTGKYRVFNALYTISNTVPRRASWAAKELAELLKLCSRQGKDPLSIYGSYAGAFGFGQFMPSSYNAYAVDYDKDGYADLYAWPDALASVANYLIRHGYQAGTADFSANSSVWKALYAYNHSSNYVNSILDLRLEIRNSRTAASGVVPLP
ncbi:MAG: hypothetical protein COT17_03615 [Elusimicrobia bacterium CG08_land_8_20_14_0_20_51_18]|nr:MAG: hypothetical protein COT17_03615 [Elusimicrobia bacterium CG08_land_8_20_14_0_20_51_18]